MATNITAGNGTNNGASILGDNTGTLNILTGPGGGTTAIAIDASQNVTIAGTLSATGGISGGGFSNMQVFTSSGTFTVPAGITKVKVTVIGGGGGSGGVFANVCCALLASSGGGAGGAAIEIISGLTAGGTVTVTVGAGGTAGAGGTTGAGGNGGTGGTSSFGAYCSATGGAGTPVRIGNVTPLDQLSYNGGLGSGGDLNIRGGCGNNSIDGLGGNGGASILGGGISGATVVVESYAGVTGGQYGGGAGGARTQSGYGNPAGGAGAAGVVVVEY